MLFFCLVILVVINSLSNYRLKYYGKETSFFILYYVATDPANSLESIWTIINCGSEVIFFFLLFFNGCFHTVHKKILTAEYFINKHQRWLVPTGDSSNTLFSTTKVAFVEELHLS